MSIEMRPLSGTRPLYVDEPEPFWPAGDDPDLYKLELWRLHKVGLVQGLRSVPCWKCGYLVIQSGLFLELEGRDGYHCRVVSWSDAHNAGILSQPFLRTLSDCWRVRPTYSKSAGYAYLGITCPKCGSLQGDNFVYDNYQGRGGVFSDPEDKSPLEVLPLPVFTDDWPQRFHWAFDSFSLDLELPGGRCQHDQGQTGRDMGQRLAMERMRPRKTMTADAASSRRGISVAE